jgi:hypothetical protein
MKIFVALFAFLAVTAAAPITISENNIGDISYITVHANGVVSSNVEANLASIIAALSNQQAALAGGDLPDLGIVPTSNISEDGNGLKNIQVSPELLSEVQKINLTPETLNAIKSAFLKE